MTDEKAAAATEQEPPRREIAVQKIYLKDLSFESPGAPQSFAQREGRPTSNLNLRTSHRKIEENAHEVTLTMTVDAKLEDETVFLVEIQQSGLFHIAGYEAAQLGAILGSYCPSTLYPYAREAVSSAVQRGGFPDFVLQPIDFDALYAQSQREAQAQQQAQAQAQQSTETH